MAAEDAVFVAANARQEVRNSLDRMEYHLGRGQRGLRGVQREMDYLNALSRQSARLGQATAGVTRPAGGLQGLGDKAFDALSGGNSAEIGRAKSSLLAGFSDDVMWGAREWTYTNNVPWVWVTNGSACAACLSNHGGVFNEYFSPEHPSCLCYPETVDRAEAHGVQQLSDSQLLDVMSGSNNPRWRAQADLVKEGKLSVRDAIQINKRPNTAARYRQEALARLQRGGVQPHARIINPIGGGPGPTPPTRPPTRTPSPAPTNPEALKETAEKIVDGWKQGEVKFAAKKHEQMWKDAIARLGAETDGTGFMNLVQRLRLDGIQSVTKGSYKGKYSWERTARNTNRFNRRISMNMKAATDDAIQRWNIAVKERNALRKSLRKQVDEATSFEAREAAQKQLDELRPLKEADFGLKADMSLEHLTDVFAHELTHAIDEASGFVLRKSWADEKLHDHVFSFYNTRNTDPAQAVWEYGWRGGTGEAVAETVRMYFLGTGTSTPIGTPVLGAAEWRAAYPKLATWVENNVLTLNPGDFY